MPTALLTVPIEISARHVHLTVDDWHRLFGPTEPTIDQTISQHPQWRAKERVILRGPKGDIPDVAMVGPFRHYSQVELAQTDARRLGLSAPLSDSGHLEKAAQITIIGVVGAITLPAAIVQQRHIHASPAEAQQAGLHEGQDVSVEVAGPRGGRLDQVLVRIHESFAWSLHLDTDEANALGIGPHASGTIVAA